MNELHFESSPYLLQHAANPIHWKAWNGQSLAKAREENKLIILSVGYSACHWCHVMEHESFEDTEVAEVMNKHFISIKVDLNLFYLGYVFSIYRGGFCCFRRHNYDYLRGFSSSHLCVCDNEFILQPCKNNF